MFKVFNYNFFSLDSLFLILLILVPISFIIGPFFINIISSFFVLIFISLNFKKINLEILRDKSIIAFLIFCTYLILNSILLNSEQSSKLHTFTFARFFLFSFAILFFLQKIKKDKFKWISCSYFAISLFVSLDIIYQFIFQKDLFGYLPGMCTYPDGKMSSCERYAGVFGDEYIAGNFLATFGVFSFFLVFKNFNISLLGKIISYLVFFIIFVSIAITGERSALIIFFGVLLLNIIFNKNIRKYLFGMLLMSMIVLILSSTIIPHIKHRLYLWPKDLFFSAKNLEKKPLWEKTMHTPWAILYLSGYEIFTKNPFFGKGYKSFRKVCSENDINEINKKYDFNLNKETTFCSTHPHNIYIELLAEIGIVGLIFFLIMIYYLIIPSLIKNYSKLERKDMTLIVFFIFLLIVTPIKPTGSISSSVYGTSIWFFIGFYLYFVRNLKNKL